MEHNHVIKLSTGKILELTDEEYGELLSTFKEVVYVPLTQPDYDWEKLYRMPPVWSGTPLSTSSD